MTRETVDGRPVFLVQTGNGYAVKWGRTEIARCDSWREAILEILDLFGVTV